MQGQLGNPFALKNNDDIVDNKDVAYFDCGGSEKLRKNSSVKEMPQRRETISVADIQENDKNTCEIGVKIEQKP